MATIYLNFISFSQIKKIFIYSPPHPPFKNVKISLSSEAIQKQVVGDFLGGPVVKTLCFQGRGAGLIPGWGTKTPHAVQLQKKKKVAGFIFSTGGSLLAPMIDGDKYYREKKNCKRSLAARV